MDWGGVCRGDKPEVFKFRNYDPETGAMRKHQRTDEQDTVEKQVEGLTQAAISQEQLTRNQELVSRARSCTTLSLGSLRTIPGPSWSSPAEHAAESGCLLQDLINIQPKKPNWDLKRDLERKLSKLKPKTDHAISTLIRTSADPNLSPRSPG